MPPSHTLASVATEDFTLPLALEQGSCEAVIALLGFGFQDLAWESTFVFRFKMYNKEPK